MDFCKLEKNKNCFLNADRLQKLAGAELTVVKLDK